ncbi:uncharacterized protein EI97DRAFT_469808 [Westerdykella ornata]|uniref:Ima1 N-terminal domain-containing protein n=1 Tax=Westerdykella ornata TaxID=318751 RepID=A0A6A6JAI4_WESOR|nr:uncharacterized protein EI97DRAFT_469808 [Westerdykella ornata]KAF2273244.1 hypothetical protein EI97DRAFT_469808 [Westerdykella ornata]
MPRLLRRRLRCFYCNNVARNEQPGIPRAWTCPRCEAVNYLDQNGQITDPPADATTTPQPVRVQYVPERPPPLVMTASTQSPFCDQCQVNQTIVNKAMAEYIPDEDDPEYEQHVATATAYREELETRYPPVCENCIGRVRDQVRAAGYAARTDHLRRILENSKKRKLVYYTPRQVWTLRTISLAKWAYISATCVGLLWHACGLLAVPEPLSLTQDQSDLGVCLGDFRNRLLVSRSCFEAALSTSLLQWAVVADFLTLWWNPKLEQKTMRPGGRVGGLMALWLLRLLVFGLRSASLVYGRYIPEDDDAVQQFRIAHGTMLGAILLTLAATWTLVKIEYRSTDSFMRPLEPYLPSVPSRPTSQPDGDYKPVRPKADIFDSMAESFTSSFDGGWQPDAHSEAPPSPTLTATSSSIDTEVNTPFAPKTLSRAVVDENDMDWTPTQRRFGKQPIGVEPHVWQKQSAPSPAPPPKKQYSLIKQQDPNPFRHKVPAFPKGPLQEKRNPWKPGIWSPASQETKNAFRDDMMKKGAGGDVEGSGNVNGLAEEERRERERLRESAVPSGVRKGEELFKQPKFKYDYYGYIGEKSTGLEDRFNGLFRM